MKDRRHWKLTALVVVFAATVLIATRTANSQVSVQEVLSAQTNPISRNVVIIGFVGGFVSRDDVKHPEVQFAAYLRDRYPTIHAEVFGNHHGRKAMQQVERLLDTDHDGVLSPLEKEKALVIIYGHSWGATETVEFARMLGKMSTPVVLTIQVDSVAKPFRNTNGIPHNVASAINFYQTEGPIHGRSKIVVDDPSKTKIIGNFRMTYDDRPINCDNYPWYARVFNQPHHKIENDLRLWDKIASLIDSDISGTTSIDKSQLPSSSPFFTYLRRGVQTDLTAIAYDDLEGETPDQL